MTIQPIATIAPIKGDSCTFSAEDARHRANSYLVGCVSTGYRAINPEFITMTPPIWQLVIQYKVPTLSPIRVGFLEVNAQTGEVTALSSSQIKAIRERVHAYLTANAPSAAVPN